MTTARRLRTLLSQAGTIAGSRWYPLRLPASPTFPLGTYQFIAGGGDVPTRDANTGDTPGNTTAYDAGSHDSLIRAVAQLTLYAKSRIELDDLEEEVRAHVHMFRGDVDGDHLSVMLNAPGVDGFDTGTDLEYRHIDATIWHRSS